LYNKRSPYGAKIAAYAIDKKCFNAGFIIFNYEDRFPEGIKQLSTWLRRKARFYTNNSGRV
jgi:NADPH-dependent curcumin reductase CurA